MSRVLRAAAMAGLMSAYGPSVAQAQVFTDFELTDTNTVVEMMGLGISRLNNSNVYGSGLTSGGNTFSYATRSFMPQLSGEYLIGNFSAGFDTALLLYADSFDPDNPEANFVSFNDDWLSQRDITVLHSVAGREQFVDFPDFDTATIEPCGAGSSRCPIVVATLDEARPYQIVVSQFNPDASFDLSIPIRLFVYGPGGAWFELPSSILERARAQIDVSSNQLSLAHALGGAGPGHSLFDAVDAIFSDAEFLMALEALSGATHAAHDGAIFQQTAMVRNLLLERVRAAMSQSPGSGALGFSGAPDDHGPGEARIWSSLYGGAGRFDASGRPAVDTRSGGIVVGADDWLDSFRLGVFGQLGRTLTLANTTDAGIESTDIGFGVYGGTEQGQTRLSFGAGYQHHAIGSKRTIAMSGTDQTLEAAYGGGTVHGFAEISQVIPLASATDLEPFAQLGLIHQHFDPVTETGGSAALSVEGRRSQSVVSTLGLRAEHRVIVGGDMLARLSGSAGWQASFGEDTMSASFAGGPTFAVEGVLAEGSALVLEAGLELDMTETSDFGVSYRGAFNQGGTSHDFQAGLSFRF